MEKERGRKSDKVKTPGEGKSGAYKEDSGEKETFCRKRFIAENQFVAAKKKKRVLGRAKRQRRGHRVLLKGEKKKDSAVSAAVAGGPDCT